MTVTYMILAIINGAIGLYFINKGIEKQGKEKFFNGTGYYYVSWVVVSTLCMMLYGTLN